MKRKQVEKLKPIPPRRKRKGRAMTAQETGDILVINMFRDGRLEKRYCINCGTGDYETLQDGAWKMRKFEETTGCGTWDREETDRLWDMEKYRLLAERKTGAVGKWGHAACRIRQMEYGYHDKKRERAHERKVERVEALMGLVPPLPGDLETWYLSLEAGRREHYMMKDGGVDGVQQYACTKCGGRWDADGLKAHGKKPVHGRYTECPGCGASVIVDRRREHIVKKGRFLLLQQMDGKRCVARHFDAAVAWGSGNRRVYVSEAARIVFEKMRDTQGVSGKCDIYWNQYRRRESYRFLAGTEKFHAVWWDANHANRTMSAGHLYPRGIREALGGTLYAVWERPFAEMAAGNWELDYNGLMRRGDDAGLASAMELLAKGRFKRLVEETAARPWWDRDSCLMLHGAGNIGEVFRLRDRQRINRIRDTDGGQVSVLWMQHEEKHGKKVGRDTLEWLEENRIGPEMLSFILDRMTANQVFHYVERQQSEPGGYLRASVRRILSQWEDYLSMCERLGRDTGDEMVYRPRELKRRHDEAVAETAEREAEITADEYSRRFPGAEAVMGEIREKYTYTGTEYMVTVPRRALDIVLDGRELHHCAGSTDRYFNRIEDHETYICFLRRTAEPEKPFYTIEVEPGGTIRQHRGYLDGEPEIEKIRPFLREWQREVKKRMTDGDRKLADRSAALRAENIRELEEKNNRRVLEALMEDFMDADGKGEW